MTDVQVGHHVDADDAREAVKGEDAYINMMLGERPVQTVYFPALGGEPTVVDEDGYGWWEA